MEHVLPHGCVDLQSSTIEGWAFDPESSDGRCRIEICVDDYVISCLTGNVARPDVAFHFDNELAGNSGFSIDLSSMCKGRNVRITVRFQEDKSVIKNGIFEIIDSKSPLEIIEGVDGYWFYTGDKSDVIRHMTGEAKSTEKALLHTAMMLSVAALVTEAHNGIHVFCMCPDKIVVHPSVFAKGFRPSKNRDSQLLIRKFSDYFGRRALYPIRDLRIEPGVKKSVTRTDSHLSWRAQYAIFKAIMKEAGLGNALDSVNVDWTSQEFVHDLAVMNGSGIVEHEDIPNITGGDLEFFPVVGSDVLICRNRRGSVPLVLMYGTSSCRVLASFVAHVAKITVHIWNGTPDIDLIKDVHPSLLINYITERNLSVLDTQFPNTGVLIRDKILEVMNIKEVLSGKYEESEVDIRADKDPGEPQVMKRARRDRNRPWPLPERE